LQWGFRKQGTWEQPDSQASQSVASSSFTHKDMQQVTSLLSESWLATLFSSLLLLLLLLPFSFENFLLIFIFDHS
jgi:hypothetical protein